MPVPLPSVAQPGCPQRRAHGRPALSLARLASRAAEGEEALPEELAAGEEWDDQVCPRPPGRRPSLAWIRHGPPSPRGSIRGQAQPHSIQTLAAISACLSSLEAAVGDQWSRGGFFDHSRPSQEPSRAAQAATWIDLCLSQLAS